MQEYYFGVPVSNAKTLCVGPITREEANSVDVSFCDGLGYYLYVADAGDDPASVEVLAKLASEDAAFRLSALLKSAGIVRAA